MNDISRHGNEKKVTWKVNKFGCWICTSHVPNGRGYVSINRNKEKLALHRYMFEKHVSKIPEGLIIRHKCDVRNCINPAHLETGTKKDNARDMAERNRSPYGDMNVNSKITEAQVIDIINSKESAKELSSRLNIDRSHISYIRRGTRRQKIYKKYDIPVPDIKRIRLTEPQILMIFDSKDKVTAKVLASTYGLSESLMHMIRNGNTHRNLLIKNHRICG